jgi:hypothetical protein
MKSINSLASTASTTDDIEFIIRIDDDDTDTISNLPNLPKNLNIKPIIGPRHGYSKIYEYLYEMFLQSNGEFVFCFSDDVQMQTPNWDLYIRKHIDDICIIFMEVEIIFAIHRKIIETYQKFSEHYAADRIYKYIALQLGIYVRYSALKIKWNYLNENDPLDSEVRARWTDNSIKWYTWKEDSKNLDKLIEDLRPYVHPELFKNHVHAEDVDKYYPLSPQY